MNLELLDDKSNFIQSKNLLTHLYQKEGQSSLSVCKKVEVTNCVSVGRFDECEQCKEGYFLNGKK